MSLNTAIILNSTRAAQITCKAEEILLDFHYEEGLHVTWNLFNHIFPSSIRLSPFLSVSFGVQRIVLTNTPGSPSNTPSSSNRQGRKQTQSRCQIIPLPASHCFLLVLTLPKSLELAKSGHACLACWTDCARKENKTQMYTNSWWCQWRDS